VEEGHPCTEDFSWQHCLNRDLWD